MNGERTTLPNGKSNEVDAAKLEVARAERELSRSFHEISDAGMATLNRAKDLARPVLIGAAAVIGVVWLVRRIQRSREPAWRRPRSTERSVFGEVARAAALSLASTAARRLADHYLHDPAGTQSTPAGRASTPRSHASTE
jgi:hypothetical protein